jgi:RNA polymerase sigma-70 factor (ECF subfamily)
LFIGCIALSFSINYFQVSLFNFKKVYLLNFTRPELKFQKLNTHVIQTDDELLDIFRGKKDLNVLGILFDRYVHLVYGLCLKYLKNRDDSKDAVMQIFELLITDIPKFEIQNFKSWLYVVSKNHCLMKLRKNSSEQNRMIAYHAEKFMETTELLHPLDGLENENMRQSLEECMDRLKAEQRNSVELFYYHQKCYKEIADEMGIEENKVKSFIQNGKRNLKICIEQKIKVTDDQSK